MIYVVKNLWQILSCYKTKGGGQDGVVKLLESDDQDIKIGMKSAA